jgi:hypothetical protein
MPIKSKKNIDPEKERISQERKSLLKKTRKRRKKSGVPTLFRKKEEDLSEEEVEMRRDAIRDFIPKIDFNAGIRTVDLKKDAEECAKYTESSCFRPDIYLDYGCFECFLYKNCKCPIKLKKRNK